MLQGDGWEVVALTTVVFNINHGPWKTAMWLAELSEAQVEYFRNKDSCSCPLFQAFLPDIARDRCREQDLTSPGFAEEMWEVANTSPQAHL